MGEHEIWVKMLAQEELAVCFLNRTDEPWNSEYNWQGLNIYHDGRAIRFKEQVFSILDLWKQEGIGTTETKLNLEIPPHGVLMVRLSPDN
jgi:alpha-galactosidase